jgi:DNA-binding SARP family transcriptional activator
MEFRLLGPLEVVDDGRPIALPAAKPRALLAVLLLARNRVVAQAALVEALWGERASATATKTLQVYVSQLRKALGPDRVVTRAPGYSLRVEEGELDLERFERLTADARAEAAAGRPKQAAAGFAEALALWRGPALEEFRLEPFAQLEGPALEGLRLGALEERIDADLDLGRHAQLVPELEALLERHPHRERLVGQLMVALYRSDRQADALDLYRRTRAELVDELGLEPGPALRELEAAILRQDASLRRARPSAPATTEAASAERRRLPVALLASLAAIALAGAVAAAFALTRDGSTQPEPRPTTTPDLRPFVLKVENFLTQSREGRREVSRTIAAASECSLPTRLAVTRLNRVQRNRQSLLQQLAALAVPSSDDALRASDLLQQSLHASITADWHYRDWLLDRGRCGGEGAAAKDDLRAAQAADRRANRAKEAFLALFNPLARRFDQRVWSPADF